MERQGPALDIAETASVEGLAGDERALTDGQEGEDAPHAGPVRGDATGDREARQRANG